MKQAQAAQKRGVPLTGHWVTYRGRAIFIGGDLGLGKGGFRGRRATTSPMRAGTPSDRARLRKLGINIPPSFTHLRVAVDARAERQAIAKSPTTGQDKSFYTRAYQQRQQAAKYHRVAALAKDMRSIVAQVNADLGKRSEAMTLRLILQTGMRNGLDNEHGTYGASSLLTSHAQTQGPYVRFRFPGKKGVAQDHTIKDAVLADYVRDRQRAKQKRLFDHTAQDTLAYLQQTAGKAYKVHDIRTLVATVTAHRALQAHKAPTTKREWSALRKQIGQEVGRVLGDTYTVALNAYIHPKVWKKHGGVSWQT